MNCYICEKTPGPGGTHYHVKVAVGICHNCNVGVCAEHSYRAAEPGSPLLCPSCTELLHGTEASQTHTQPDLQPA